MNEPEKINPRELSPLALAFVGDSVRELLVRQRLVEHNLRLVVYIARRFENTGRVGQSGHRHQHHAQ